MLYYFKKLNNKQFFNKKLLQSYRSVIDTQEFVILSTYYQVSQSSTTMRENSFIAYPAEFTFLVIEGIIES